MKVSYVVVIIESCTKRKVYGINSMKVEGVPLISFSSNSKHRYHHAFFVLFFFCVVFFPTHIGRKTISPSNLKFPLGSGSITKTISFIMSQYPTYTSYNNLDIGPMYVLLIIKIVFCVGTMYVLIKF